jgi:hypothetical protein
MTPLFFGLLTQLLSYSEAISQTLRASLIMNSSDISRRVTAQLAAIAIVLTIGLCGACNLKAPKSCAKN